ncbi:retinol dehydrogenase 12 [Whalleya microplaca]|nr:retinol dehydrogenase 12 [Whalleya microplaca]
MSVEPTQQPPRASATSPEETASIRRFLYRQFFVTLPLPTDVNLQGKIAIVTGANTGIGLECARQLLDLHVDKLIIAVRNEEKGQKAKANLLSGRQVEPDAVDVWKLDLESYDSINSFVERAKALDHLDIAVLNAGVMNQEYLVTVPTNHELTIQVNVLSTALLSIQLLPLLKAKSASDPPGRLVFVSSDMAFWAKFKEKNAMPLLPTLDKPESFGVPERYCVSKLLGQIFVSELSKRVPPSTVLITMPNPGLCYGTSLGVAPGGSFVDKVAAVLKRIFGRSPSVGARALTDGAVHHGAEAHGQYLQDCQPLGQSPSLTRPEAERLGQTLWDEVMSDLAFSQVEEIVQGLKV